MSMQINLQHVFKMSASERMHASERLLRTCRPDVQQDRHGLRWSFKTRLHRVGFFCRPGGKNKQCLLPRRAADAEVIASH